MFYLRATGTITLLNLIKFPYFRPKKTPTPTTFCRFPQYNFHYSKLEWTLQSTTLSH